MRIVRFLLQEEESPRIGLELGDGIRQLPVSSLAELLHLSLEDIRDLVESAIGLPTVIDKVRLLPPIDGRMEVWAAGVTYQRSREARIEESTQADVYDRIYVSERPELFFKCVGWRTVTNGEPIAIRRDSTLNVPEPELAVVANKRAELVGYAVCNDVSSRSIEASNPLYLPQAKIYAGACALSAGIRPVWDVHDVRALDVRATVERAGLVVWDAATSTSQLSRQPADLLEFLFREEHFPDGVVLSTGTGLVPDMDFTLHEGDRVTICIAEVGVLTSFVVCGRDHFEWLSGSLAGRPVPISNDTCGYADVGHC